jgi:hypothetical protein
MEFILKINRRLLNKIIEHTNYFIKNETLTVYLKVYLTMWVMLHYFLQSFLGKFSPPYEFKIH